MTKNVGLGVSVKVRNEFDDYDYIEELSADEYKWLNRFHQEYLNANFKNEEYIHPKMYHKSVYGDNNCRNRDLYAICKVTGRLYYCYGDIGSKSYIVGFTTNEDSYIAALDLKERWKNSDFYNSSK